MKWQSAINTGARFPDIEPVRRRLAAAGGKLYGTTFEGVAVSDLADPAVPVLAKLNVTTIAGWKHLVPVMGTLRLRRMGSGSTTRNPMTFPSTISVRMEPDFNSSRRFRPRNEARL